MKRYTLLILTILVLAPFSALIDESTVKSESFQSLEISVDPFETLVNNFNNSTPFYSFANETLDTNYGQSGASGNTVEHIQIHEDETNLTILYYSKAIGKWVLREWNGVSWSIQLFAPPSYTYDTGNNLPRGFEGDYFLWRDSLFRIEARQTASQTPHHLYGRSVTMTLHVEELQNGVWVEKSNASVAISNPNPWFITDADKECQNENGVDQAYAGEVGNNQLMFAKNKIFDVSENGLIVLSKVDRWGNTGGSQYETTVHHSYFNWNGTSTTFSDIYHTKARQYSSGNCWLELENVALNNHQYAFTYNIESTSSSKVSKFENRNSSNLSEVFNTETIDLGTIIHKQFLLKNDSNGQIFLPFRNNNEVKLYSLQINGSLNLISSTNNTSGWGGNTCSITTQSSSSTILCGGRFHFQKDTGRWGESKIYNPFTGNYSLIPNKVLGYVNTSFGPVIISQNPFDGQDLVIMWKDSDGDGYHNLIDSFDLEPSQHSDTDNDGYGDNLSGVYPDYCPFQFGISYVDVYGCSDYDFDGVSDTGDVFSRDNTQWNDTDGDGFGDNLTGNFGDNCPNEAGTSTKDKYGCLDSDDDGWSDESDLFANESSQWSDSDGDGYGDRLIGLEGDSCPFTIGNSTKDRYGCIDSDGDRWSDDGDDLPQNPTQWRDRDGDGYGDNQEENSTMSDAFPADGTQWNDTDGDGHGDNPFGTQGDWFPNDPTRWQDSDQDGVADEDDAFPNEITQWNDTDGDGYGDEENGNQGDAFPNDDAEWFDSDMDGLGDNADAFPFDPTQKVDADGDGMGDNPMGIGADKFPDDATQWGDIDGDGYGDNPNGTNSDAFITDATQWSDEDGDGYGDNPAGRLYDQFPQNPTQWLDEDGDGLGDNQSGTNADPFLNDFDNDGYNDSIDPLPKLATPGDLDNDGVLDLNDLFPEDAREWADYDGDGEGDNADTDDDNDGWADTEEIRLGFDPFNSAEEPVDSFEIVIPGTAVGLGAWDLIGMFGGIPLALWIGFGFVTRNGRTAKYEALLREAQTRDELEGVARKWEYSLMLRMLGPHQGIRLERLRAELDDVFEAQNQKLSSIEPQEHDQTQMVEQAMQEDQKSLPSIESAQPEITAQGNPDGKGYEWYTDGQETSWYRNEGSNSVWQRFEA